MPSARKTRPPLTDTRRTWAQTRGHDGVMRGTRLALPAGVADRYAHKLKKLADQMTRETRSAIEDLYSHPDVQEYFKGFAHDISPAAQARILTNKLQERFAQLFAQSAKDDAQRMVDEANDASAADIERSLKELSGGLKLNTDILTNQMREFMSATVANNVSLIKSIPSEYFMDVQGAVLRSIADGKGLADLVPFLERQEGVQRRRAENIATDQTHKAYNGLNKGRMQQNGIKKFEWVHSGGGLYPREHHIDPAPAGLNHGIFSLDKLPIIDLSTGERGIPGQAINCRCTMVPVIDFEDGKPK